jgi:hypothetical protein
VRIARTAASGISVPAKRRRSSPGKLLAVRRSEFFVLAEHRDYLGAFRDHIGT